MAEWISVEDRLPKPFEHILGYVADSGDGSFIGERYSLGGKSIYFIALNDIRLATHWMPLPEPPKGE